MEQRIAELEAKLMATQRLLQAALVLLDRQSFDVDVLRYAMQNSGNSAIQYLGDDLQVMMGNIKPDKPLLDMLNPIFEHQQKM